MFVCVCVAVASKNRQFFGQYETATSTVTTFISTTSSADDVDDVTDVVVRVGSGRRNDRYDQPQQLLVFVVAFKDVFFSSEQVLFKRFVFLM